MARALLVAALITGALGCDELLRGLRSDGGLSGLRADAAPPPAEVGGRWTLRGEGRLSGCEAPRFNTRHFTLTSVVLEVSQAPETAILSLTRSPAGAEGFHWVGGQVRHDAVRFEIREETRDGDISLSFEGEMEGPSRFGGRFTGEGPAGCTSRGDFSVDID